MTANKSGKVIGQEYLARVQAYLQSTPTLPLQPDGTLNVTAIAAGADVPRQSLYKHPKIRELLDAAKASQAIPSRQLDHAPGQEVKRRLERRVHQLEQENAVLMAENAELRRQLKVFKQQQARDDLMMETGRRIPAPPSCG